MKKRFITFLILAMILMMTVPSMIFADDIVAKIGTQEYTSLQLALDDAKLAGGDQEIVLCPVTIDEDIVIEQVKDTNITIIGNGATFTGQIFIDGNSRATGSETITIDGINFNTNEDEHKFINTDKASDKRYPHNLTIQNCSFTSTASTKAPAIYWRQGYKLNVINCKADGVMSLVNSISGVGPVTVKDCTIKNCGNGIVSSTEEVNVINSNINTSGAAVVGDGSSKRTLTVESCVINGEIPILFKSVTSDKSKLVINGNNDLKATNLEGFVVVITKENSTSFVKPEAAATIEINDPNLVSEDGFTYVNSQNEEPKEEAPKTGDMSNVIFLLSLMMISICGIALTLVYSIKR